MELPDAFAWTATLFDSASKAIVAAGTLVAALLAAVAYRARKDPPPPGTPDALVLALAELTAAVKSQSGSFAENLRLFEEIVSLTERLLEETKDTRRGVDHSREHLSAIRDAVNRSK